MTYSKSLEELQARVAKTVVVASGILLFALAIYDFSVGLFYISMAKLPLVAIFIWNYFSLARQGYHEKYAHLTVVTTLVFFAINYFYNQGTDGPTLYGTVCLFVAYPILFSSSWKWFYMSFTVIFVIVLLYLGLDKNNLALPFYQNAQIQFVDHAVAFSAVSIYVMILVGNVIDYYKKQNKQLGLVQDQLRDQIAWVESEKLQKENLLGIFAHDVKNPVLTLGQLIELYQNEVLTEDELRNLMNGMQSRFLDLQNTIEQIVTQIKTQMHSNSHNNVEVSPIEIIQKLESTIKYKFDAKNQKLVLEHPEKTKQPLKYGQNANEVSIILKNLLDNASKYSPENTTIKLSLTESVNQLVWEIEDEGEGLTSDIQKDLFAKGVQSNKGSGIGLFLCNSIAKNIGAQLQYKAKDIGSVFRLTLKLEA